MYHIINFTSKRVLLFFCSLSDLYDMKKSAKRKKEKQIRNIKISAGKWFHIEAENLPESALLKLIITMIALRVIRSWEIIVLGKIGLIKLVLTVKEWWP